MQGATTLDSKTSAYHPSLFCHNVNLAENNRLFFKRTQPQPELRKKQGTIFTSSESTTFTLGS